MMFQTRRLVIRNWEEADAEALYKYASDARVSEPALWPRHTSPEMSRKVISEFFMPNAYTFAIVARSVGEAIGCIGLVPAGEEYFALKGNEREVGYWVGRPFWGQGIATESLMGLIAYCRDSIGLESLLITTLATNAASQRVAVKCGFRFVDNFIHDGLACHAYRLSLKRDNMV